SSLPITHDKLWFYHIPYFLVNCLFESKVAPWLVYPNPFVESFKASFEKEFSSINVIIQNTLGQTIYQKDYSNQSEISVELQNLASQTYLVTIIADDQTFKAKLIQR
ncbi:MAG: T9SS type A sorting domain-containing protein, partial [Flavobacteriaceae bacterium]